MNQQNTPLAFADCETTHLDAEIGDAWEVAVIRRDPDGIETENLWHIRVDLEQENAHQAEQIKSVRDWATSHEYRWLHELLDGYGTHGGHL